MNESNNAGYDGTHGGYGYGVSNADSARILEFADGLNLVVLLRWQEFATRSLAVFLLTCHHGAGGLCQR